MVSLDPSTMNIVLTVAVAGLFIFFIALLIKLNPSAEKKKKDFETNIEIEEQQPSIIVPKHLQPQPEPARIEIPRTAESPRAAEKPLVAVAPTIGGASTQTKQEASTPTLSQSREIPKPPEKTLTSTPAKTGFAPTKKDCLHHFGYLRTFPKNSPIPDECFGCEKIVDCLVNNKKSSKNER